MFDNGCWFDNRRRCDNFNNLCHLDCGGRFINRCCCFLGRSLLGCGLLRRCLLRGCIIALDYCGLCCCFLSGSLLGCGLLRRLFFLGLNIALQTVAFGFAANAVGLGIFHCR